jgi:hypothetical protein
MAKRIVLPALAVIVPPFTVTGQVPEHAGTAVPFREMGLLVPAPVFEYVTGCVPPVPSLHVVVNVLSELVVLSFVHVVPPVTTLTAQMVLPVFTTMLAYEQEAGRPPVTAPAGLASEPMMAGAAHATAPAAAVRLMSVRRPMPGRSTSRSSRSLISYPVSPTPRATRRSCADYRRGLHGSSIDLPRVASEMESRTNAVIYTRRFDALGFAFDVEAEDPRLIAYLERLYEPFPDPGRADHRYAFPATTSDGEACELRFDEDRVIEAEVVEALVGPLVHDLNRRALDGSEHLILHAGGVVHDGVGIVFPGEMEAGKTTLAAGLVRAGLGYLTDEGVAIDRESLRIHPYPKPLSIDSGAWPLFPELEPDVDLATDAYKADQWQVPPTAIRPDSLGHACPVDVIVFPEHVPGGETSVEPLGRAEALIELAKNTYKFNVQERAALDVLAELVRQATCYRLRNGNLDAAVRAVTGLLATAPGEPDTPVSVR